MQAALDELKALQEYDPDLVYREADYPYIECSTFADDIKGEGYSFQSDWHFIDQPYLDEAGTSLDDFDFTQPSEDVVGALTDCTAFLKGEMSASESTYLTAIADKFSYEEDQRSFALRLVIHYVGDLH